MKRKNESGVVVVEAAIVVTVVTMFIAVMLYIGMVLYQQSLVNIMANQTASNIAQIYGNTLRDPFTGYVDADGVHETVTYSNIRNQAYMDVIEQKADAAALYRLKSSRILTTGDTEVEVNIVPKKNELLKDQIVVTVTDTYEIPLISFFGAGNNRLTFTGTGRADCTDLLEYLTGVPAMGTNDGNAVIFSPDECTVNFYKHYGDSRPLKTMTVLRGNSVNSSTDYSHSAMPSKPTQDKMRFTKWITEDGRTFTGDSIVNEDMLNVYGNWECTVTFDPDGGRLIDLEPPTMTATVTGNIALPDAERDNCTFAGWFTKKNGEGEEFTGINVQGDITVYAKWICTVTFNSDGGTVSPNSVDVVYGKSFKDIGFTLPIPTRTDCSYGGWFDGLHGEGKKYSDNDTIKGHKTLNSKWLCNVTLEPNGGSVSNKNITAVVGKKLSVNNPAAPYKCWSFIKWTFKSDGTGKVFKSNDTVVEGKTTLYAQWSCNHVYTNDKEVTPAKNCKSYSIRQRTCKHCGHVDEYRGGKGNHLFEGKCGKTHDLGDDAYAMKNHAGDDYKRTTKAECNICLYCYEGWDGVSGDVEYAGWTWRNGEKVSIGMYCREHEYEDGTKYDDDAYSEREDRKLHK